MNPAEHASDLYTVGEPEPTPDEVTRAIEKAERNTQAALRNASKHRSIVNFESYRQTGQPIRFTPENRRADKADILHAEAERIAAGGHTTKSKRKRLEKQANSEGTHPPLNMLRLGSSRRDRRRDASEARRKRNR